MPTRPAAASPARRAGSTSASQAVAPTPPAPAVDAHATSSQPRQSSTQSPSGSHRAPRGLEITLLAVVAAVWVWAAIDPTYRFDWFLENLLVFITLPLLMWIHRRHPISAVSLVLLAAFYVLHLIGSHWTYSNVPLPWERMGFERNHYDRVVHFAYGLLLTYPAKEALGWRGETGNWAWLLAVQAVVATSALYEVVEWAVAVIVAPGAASAFLGTQGDEFDAVADMAHAGLGALLAWGAGSMLGLGRSEGRGAVAH